MCITMNLEAAWAIKGLVANRAYVFPRTAGWGTGRCGVFVNYVLRIVGQWWRVLSTFRVIQRNTKNIYLIRKRKTRWTVDRDMRDAWWPRDRSAVENTSTIVVGMVWCRSETRQVFACTGKGKMLRLGTIGRFCMMGATSHIVSLLEEN